jgi:hypothetical protein
MAFALRACAMLDGQDDRLLPPLADPLISTDATVKAN